MGPEMKQGVFDVLMYLFENFFWEDDLPDADQDAIEEELLHAGFERDTIGKAFGWLEDLGHLQAGSEETASPNNSGLRVFTAQEEARLDRDCRGLLLALENRGLLDTVGREAVIERTMALENDSVDLDQLKWVVSMVMFNRVGKQQGGPWMEEFVLQDHPMTLH